MLPVAELKVGHERYWLREVARSLCDYYAGRGEAPGVLFGARAREAGIEGQQAVEDLVVAMSAGKDPITGEQIAKPLWRADPRSKLDAAPIAHALRELAAARGLASVEDLARSRALRQDIRSALHGKDRIKVETVERLARMVLQTDPRQLYDREEYERAEQYRGKRVDTRVAAFDLCFSEPKSVSLLMAGGGERVRSEGNAARDASLTVTLGLLESRALGVRRGHNGTERQQADGGVFATAFTHRINREGEPHWHRHVLVQNAPKGPDGRWSAIDSRKMYAWMMTLQHVYHACMRNELANRLDVRFREVDQYGTAEIDGLHDPQLLAAFSSRVDQVEERKAEWAESGLETEGIKAGSKAARATRKAKPHNAEGDRTIYQRWEADLAGHGIDHEAFGRVLGNDGRRRERLRRELTKEQAERLLDELGAALTEQRSTFTERDVLCELSKRLPQLQANPPGDPRAAAGTGRPVPGL